MDLNQLVHTINSKKTVIVILLLFVCCMLGTGFAINQHQKNLKLERSLTQARASAKQDADSLNHKETEKPTDQGTVPVQQSSNTLQQSAPAPVATVTNTAPAYDRCVSAESIDSIGVSQSSADSNYSGYLNSKSYYTGNSTYTPQQQQQKIQEEYIRFKGYVERDYQTYLGQIQSVGCSPKTSRPTFGNP